MIRAVLVTTLILWTQSASPCSVRVGGDEDWRIADMTDRAEQRALVTELTSQADTILIATVERIDKTSPSKFAQFRVKQVLKGTATEGKLLAFALPQMATIGCTVASMFKNSWAHEGIDYVVYAQGDQLLRTGKWDRDWPEISVREEIRRIRKTLKGLDV